MITEDYVSFETARLLKEKGFESDECIAIYDLGNNNAFIRDSAIFDNGPEDYLEFQWGEEWRRFGYYLAPTLQMTRKWLRDKHHLHIEIRITNHSMSDMANIVKYYWVMTNTETGRWCDESTIYTAKAFDKSEEAEEDAIRHALEKLI